jgi:predicted nucleic acid-binding protein
LKVYLDTSFIVALFVEDPHTDRANAFIQDRQPEIIVSDFAAAEFSAAIARYLRVGRTTREAAKAVFADFDAWTHLFAQRFETASPDVRTAEVFIRRLDLNLRAPDALHRDSATRRRYACNL